jgi:threonine synthase
LKEASFVDALDCAAAFAGRHGLVSDNGFFNPGRREGLKLAFLEAVEQVPRTIDWYVQSVSTAMGVYGVYKGARELFEMKRIARLPRLLCVQQESCAPMARSWKSGSTTLRPEHVVQQPNGIAKAILQGNPARPYPYVHGIVSATQGDFVIVAEAEIREARKMVEELEGISPCYSAAAALAGVIRQVRTGVFPHDNTVLVNLTGGNRPAPVPSNHVTWLQPGPKGWVPQDSFDAATEALWHRSPPRSPSVPSMFEASRIG